jgi:hypothetical protein
VLSSFGGNLDSPALGSRSVHIEDFRRKRGSEITVTLIDPAKKK